MKIRADISLNVSVAAFVFFVAAVFSHDYDAAAVCGLACFLFTVHAAFGSLTGAVLVIAEQLGWDPEDGDDRAEDAPPEVEKK